MSSATTAEKRPTEKKFIMLQGGALVKHVMKKSGKGGTALTVDDLNEDILQARLKKLNTELTDYKTKCSKYKIENEWYRNEIETCQRDTAEYISYLQSKKMEKVTAIDELVTSNNKDWKAFIEKRAFQEQANDTKLQNIRAYILELDVKLQAKEAEISLLSDTMARRAKHETDMSKIRGEMEKAENDHTVKMKELEKSLLESRVTLQKEAEIKIKSMESAAQEKAAKYLADHTSAIEQDNRRLEKELGRVTLVTQEYLTRKTRLEHENKELEREQKLREDLVQIRLKKVQNAVTHHNQSQGRERERINERQKKIVNHVLAQRGLGELSNCLSPNMFDDLNNLGAEAGMCDKAFEDDWLDIVEEE